MADILNRVAYNQKRYKIARHNKEMAIIISIEEWNAIEKIYKNWKTKKIYKRHCWPYKKWKNKDLLK